MSTLVEKAIQTAFHEVEHKTRPGNGCPSPCHLLSCVQIVAGYGGDAITQAAAALHEIIEVVRWTVDRVKKEFGQPVASLVAQVTEDRRLPWRDRKQEIIDRAGHCEQAVGAVLMADKLDTLLAFCREQHGSADYWTTFQAGFADHLWFYQTLLRALRSNRQVTENADDPQLRTVALLDELTATLDRFRGGHVWTPDGLRPGHLEDVLK